MLTSDHLAGPTVLHALLRVGVPLLLPFSAHEFRTEATSASAVAGGILFPVSALPCLAVRLPHCPPLSKPFGLQVRTVTGYVRSNPGVWLRQAGVWLRQDAAGLSCLTDLNHPQGKGGGVLRALWTLGAGRRPSGRSRTRIDPDIDLSGQGC